MGLCPCPAPPLPLPTTIPGNALSILFTMQSFPSSVLWALLLTAWFKSHYLSRIAPMLPSLLKLTFPPDGLLPGLGNNCFRQLWFFSIKEHSPEEQGHKHIPVFIQQMWNEWPHFTYLTHGLLKRMFSALGWAWWHIPIILPLEALLWKDPVFQDRLNCISKRGNIQWVIVWIYSNRFQIRF